MVVFHSREGICSVQSLRSHTANSSLSLTHLSALQGAEPLPELLLCPSPLQVHYQNALCH